MNRPAHRATTAALQAAYPFLAGGSLGAAGVLIGRDLYGSAFVYDPFLAYDARLVGSPNMVVIGQLGRGKSSFVKTYAWRQLVFGRQVWILDPKGEYAPLAAACGVEPLRLRPGGTWRLNPLDPGALAADETPREVLLRQLRLLTSLAEGALGRPLAPGEHAACQEALRAITDRDPAAATLPMVVDALLAPDADAARRVGTTAVALAAESRDVALGLRRLVWGDLAGMFDGPTTPGLDLTGRMVVLDLSAVRNSAALGLLMTCATAFLHARLSVRDHIKRIVIIDEAWAVLNDVGVARWMQASWKLARQYGVQHIAVLHRLSDLDAAGAAGSEQANLARGLLSDTETRVVYGQPDSEIPTSQQLLGLSDTEARMLPALGTGIALWKVGMRSFLVQHRIGATEAAIIDTDAAMTDRPHP